MPLEIMISVMLAVFVLTLLSLLFEFGEGD